jgi:GDPmannose 4,6-dehydratase
MAKKALITGVLGQDGAYLAKFLTEKGYRVYGMVRRHSNNNFINTDYLGITKDIEFVSGDLTDEMSLISLVKRIQPDEVYNLGAQSFVGVSWDQTKHTTEVNALGTLYLLNALKMFAPMAKFYQASTSEMFGNANTPLQNEETPFCPRNPYGVAKLYAHFMTKNFQDSYDMFATAGILFNHESPIRGPEFVTRKISMGVAQIKKGLATEIALGNLDSKRDWGFAGDYVEAMWLILQQEKPDVYVIATGETHTIQDFVEEAFRCVGITDWEKHIRIDPRFKRPAELNVLCGDTTKAQKELGWKPKTSFKELVDMMVKADVLRLETRS